MRTALSESSKPLLGPDVRFTESGGDLDLHSYDETIYTYSGRSAEIVGAIKDRLDGRSQLADLAESAGASPEEVSDTLAVLAEDYVLIDAAAAVEAASPQEFLEAFLALCRFWTRYIFNHEFWRLVVAGEASTKLMLGWGIEYYHYHNGAHEHMTAAAAHCQDVTLQQWLAKHYAEEYEHDQLFFLGGLVGCGLDRREVVAAPPLPTTRALVAYLKDLAVSDTVAYTGAFAVGIPGQTREGVNRFYDSMAASYPAAARMLNAFRAHSLRDIDLDHQDIIFQQIFGREDLLRKYVCDADGLVRPERARSIVAAARGVVEHFTAFFDGIYRFYSRPDVPTIRNPLDIKMVL